MWQRDMDVSSVIAIKYELRYCPRWVQTRTDLAQSWTSRHLVRMKDKLKRQLEPVSQFAPM